MTKDGINDATDDKKADEKWVDYFRKCEGVLYFDCVAGDLAFDLAHNIVDNVFLTSTREKQERLYDDLEKMFDETQDDFEVVVIGTFFKAEKFLRCYVGLGNFVCELKKVKEYKGKSGERFKEFSEKILDSSLRLTEALVTAEKQFQIAKGLTEVALAWAGGGEQNVEIQSKLNKLVMGVRFSENEVLSAEKFDFMINTIKVLLKDKKKAYRTTGLLAKIDLMIEFMKKCGDDGWILPAIYRLKMEYYKKSNETKREQEIALCLAETYVAFAEKRAEIDTSMGFECAVFEHYPRAIKTLKEYGFTERLVTVKREYDNLKLKWNNMTSATKFTCKISVRVDMTEEEQKLLKDYLTAFSYLSLPNQIKCLASQVQLVAKDDVKLSQQQTKENNSLSEVFLETNMNEHGQTTWEANSEENKENKVLFDWVSLNSKLYGDCLGIIRQHIEQSRTCFVSLDFTKLFEESVAISVLAKRADVINRAFQLFFMGDDYSALHILIPQVEYWFREEVYALGGQTSNLKSFSEESPIEGAKMLGSVFGEPKLKEYLGEDMHWLFEKLMTKEPMNLRNKIAHGISLNGDGCGIYFILATLKLLLIKQALTV